MNIILPAIRGVSGKKFYPLLLPQSTQKTFMTSEGMGISFHLLGVLKFNSVLILPLGT